jgi:hypothetical protein
MFNLKSKPNSRPDRNPIEIPDHQHVLPPLVSAYHERGYEAGYARGKNDVLAAVLETTDEFSRLEPESAAETRKLLYAFSKFLEEQIQRSPRDSDHGFVDGSGI